MKILKIIKTMILYVAVFCLCFSSCAKSMGNIDDVFSQLEISDNETETQIPAFTEHIYVIIPDDCSGELSIKARELTDKIKEKTQILTSLKYDNELTIAPKNSCEILIGNTNRLASENALDILRTDEYLCHWDDGAIVICGCNDVSTIAAIEKFINEILPLSSKYSLMHKDMSFEFSCNYSVKNIKLNGYDLYDYVLTYAKANKNQEKAIAFMLRDYIKQQSGYLLEVVADDEVTSKDGRIISLLGASDENAVLSTERKVLFLGTDSYMLSLAVAKFIRDFEDNIIDSNVELNYYKKVEIEEVDSLLKSGVYFLNENKVEPFKPIYNLIELLESENMGVCFVGNPNDDMREDFAINVKEHIKLREFLIGERELTVAYNEKNIKQIDIEFDESKGRITVDVETLFDEKLSLVYIVDAEYIITDELLKANSVIFCENPVKTEYEQIVTVQSGVFNVFENEFGYLYANGENIRIKNSQDTVRNDENGFCCVMNNNFIYSDEFLNYTLK